MISRECWAVAAACFVGLAGSGAGAGVEVTLRAQPDFQKGIVSGLEVRDGQLVLYRIEDTFKTDSRQQYKIRGSISDGVDEFGITNSVTDAAMATIQTRPDNCLLVETHDNDAITIARDVAPTTKGVLSMDIWPLRFWPTSGRLNVDLIESGERSISFALAASDYKNPTTKTYDGATLSSPGGKPYFTSTVNSDIYQPSYPVPKSEQRWWPVRLLFRPAYVAGSLDGSVCREIKDPARKPIMVRRIEFGIGQLETYIRALRFKSLLGEAVSSPLPRTGSKWVEVKWDGATPDKTRIGVQIRTADTEGDLSQAAWSGPTADKPYFTEPGAIAAAVAVRKWMQVRILLKAEQDAPFEVTPALRTVTVVQQQGDAP